MSSFDPFLTDRRPAKKNKKRTISLARETLKQEAPQSLAALR